MLRLECCPLVRNHSRFQVAPVMDRYHKSYQRLNGTKSQRKSRTKLWLRFRARIDTQVFFFRGYVRSILSVRFLGIFSKLRRLEDWKMTLEELRLGYSNLWDQTWNFPKQSVELANCSIVPFPYFPRFLLQLLLLLHGFHSINVEFMLSLGIVQQGPR